MLVFYQKRKKMLAECLKLIILEEVLNNLYAYSENNFLLFSLFPIKTLETGNQVISRQFCN